MRSNAPRLLSLLFGMMLTACGTTPITGTLDRDPLCSADAIIAFSALSDSPETIAQVRRHNAAWRAICSGA
jgi:hypothetical protein